MKRYYDSVHGFIHVSDEEKELFDKAPFMRLNYLHQLGVSYLVYPGATHSRFEHSLGVMHLATKLYDHLFPASNDIYRQALRIGAISHDLGHLPFSHTLESTLLGPHGHEIKTLEILDYLKNEPFFQKYELQHPGFLKLCMKIAVSPHHFQSYFPGDSYSEKELVLSSLVSGDYFGADRIDYLVRDSVKTGVSVGLFDYPQLIEMLTLVEHDNQLKLAIKEEGLHAVEGLLLARHYMHARVYQHQTVRAYNRALKEFVSALHLGSFETMEPKEYITYTDGWLSDRFIRASFDKYSQGHNWALILTKQTAKIPIEPTKVMMKTPGALLIEKRSGVLESKVPASLDRIFF